MAAEILKVGLDSTANTQATEAIYVPEQHQAVVSVNTLSSTRNGTLQRSFNGGVTWRNVADAVNKDTVTFTHDGLDYPLVFPGVYRILFNFAVADAVTVYLSRGVNNI